MSFSVSPKNCFISAPYLELENGLLDLFIEHKLQPEIGLEGNVLYDRTLSEFEKTAQILKENQLSCTIHAPFFDLAPGALDPHIRQVTREKLHKAFELIQIFKPSAIICHLSFEDNKHGYKVEEWHKRSTETWRTLTKIAAKYQTTVMFENTYETNPEQHLRILQTIKSDYARFCLDVGHLQSFAKTPWQNWLPIMNPWLGHLHLHDNHGELDTHLGIGRGTFDFASLFSFLAKNKLTPSVTLEPHTKDDLWTSLDALAEMGVVNLKQ